MDGIRVQKDKLIATIKKNREEHRAIFMENTMLMKLNAIDKKIVLRAAELIDQGFCKYTQAKNAQGQRVSPCAEAAASWCIAGAIVRAEKEITGELAEPLYAWGAIESGMPKSSIWQHMMLEGREAYWNNQNERTADEVSDYLRDLAGR